ncbi:MAG: type I restriction-modification system subunit M [Clostridia bacterium]|jgi:type I restriction enzyme M protein|nr:type I restriction-modification system subunit M [Clostridia bacterium]
MAVKKSELYNSLWDSCDQLRGSMDASQYKDYILVLLFMKYVSDKNRISLADVPEGASFSDMVKFKGKTDIGDQINKIIGKMAEANELTGIITVADFNDDEKLGRGKDKVDRLSNLIAIFERPELDFSKNMADGDDLLGDAYEYLMRLFATESGKSKGQFYTPAEVSRIMASLIGINQSKSQSETLYDPTCGSGSLLLKAASETQNNITIYGQEYDNATRALCVMNMWLHDNPDSDIRLGNTLSNPQFLDDNTGALKQFDYAVANPPFSYKSWKNGWDPEHDIFKRFEGYPLPPDKNGDYAFLIHLVKSLKSKGKGCIVMPLGVLFRGNAEGLLRKRLIQQGYIKGIIGLPPNLFYGTGIAACLIVIDKEHAAERKSIFMIDASKGFIKDGNKNRLREQDIHKIIDTFLSETENPKYSRIVPIEEIASEKNDYNLNIPRYIDNQDEEDIQDIQAHLSGGVPRHDVESLEAYWQVFPTLKKDLFNATEREGYFELSVETESVREFILNHENSIDFKQSLLSEFESWKQNIVASLKTMELGAKPKEIIEDVSERLLQLFTDKPLTDKYDLYQLLMDYWYEVMQDDVYVISTGGWTVGKELSRLMKKNSKGVDKAVSGLDGLEGRIIPTSLIIQEYFPELWQQIEDIEAELDSIKSRKAEIDEENGTTDDSLINDAYDEGKTSKKQLKDTLVNLGKRDDENAEAFDLLTEYLELLEKEPSMKKSLNALKDEVERKVISKYPKLSEEEIKTLIVDKKWFSTISERIESELDNISHRLSNRIKELAERYEKPLVEIEKEVDDLTSKVEEHLKAMGMVL